jgi:hypothetical protein
MNVPNAAELPRTGLWSRRISDFVALALVACALIEFCSQILGIRDSLSIVVLTLGCASHPLLRLLETRRFEHEPGTTRGAEIAAVVAAAPWIILGWLHGVHPTWVAWQSVPVPALFRYTGCAIAFGVVLARPIVRRDRAEIDDAMYVPPITVQSQLLMISLLLVSFSAIAAGLILYWLAAAGVQRLVSRSNAIDGGLGELQSVQAVTR